MKISSMIMSIKMKLILIVIAIGILCVVCHQNEHHHHHHQNQHHQHDHHDHHDHHHDHNHDHHHNYNHKQHQSAHDDSEQVMPNSNQSPREKLIDFFIGCQKQIDEWVYIPKTKPLEQLLQTCGVFSNADYLLQFYKQLSSFKTDFTKEHIDLMIKQFKKLRTAPQVLSCIVKERQIQNHYLQERKKYKYLAQFIKRYPLQGKDAFSIHSNYTQIGKKTCHFFKALFEYYYLEVLSPSETLSTEFLRALTVRSEVFEHEDIAFCVAIETVGRLSGELEEIDINNVFLKLPEIFHALRFLKLKQHCRDQHHKKLVGNLHSALEGLDMFKIMYKEYQPFVEIATEKMVQTQIRLLARKFADMIADKQKYLEYSKLNLESDL